MRHLTLALFAVALLLTAAQADDWSKTYNIEHAPQLRVDTSDADIRLDTWDQNKIEAHVFTEGWKIGEGGIKILERQTGDTIEIEVRFPHRNFVLDIRQRRVQIVIHMPRAGKIGLRTGDGRISVNHLKGEMDLYSGDGRVSLMARRGSRVARSWDVRTSDGSVSLELPADLAADLDLHTGDGHISLNLPLTVEGKFSNQDVHGKLNGGGNRLVVHTGDGSITVDKS